MSSRQSTLFDAEPVDDVGDGLSQRDRSALDVALVHEEEEVADHGGGALQLARERADLLDPAHLERLGLETLGQQARRRQRVVDLVRDARDQAADRRELLGLRELLAGTSGLFVEPRIAHCDGGLVANGPQSCPVGIER